LLDSRVVDLPMASNPTLVMPSSLKPSLNFSQFVAAQKYVNR
jgi:hypothetical protein